MAAITFADDLVRDYLLYRGFMGALKALDSDIKADKDRGFRADRIVDHLSSCINSLDLNSLRESWGHLDKQIFSRLEHSFLSTARKLETALLRMYVITCLTNNRQDKLMEFFEKMMSELQGQMEWKDWFALPFNKSPEENPAFQVYFTRQWQDTMLMSLHNFLSVVFQSMAVPTLLSCGDEILHLGALQEENDALKQKLSLATGVDATEKADSRDIPAPPDIMDDFYVIAQEAPVVESQGRTFRSLIKNISSGLPTSPLVGRKSNGTRRNNTVSETVSSGKPVSAVKPKPRAPSQPPQSLISSTSTCGASSSFSSSSTCTTVARVRPTTDYHPETSRGRPTSVTQPREENRASERSRAGKSLALSSVTANIPLTGNDQKSTLLLLSQEEYAEHHATITHCKFNCSGTVVASSDIEGVIKVWSPIPSPQTIASVMSRSSILALEWACKREKLLLHGNIAGQIRLYDTKDKRTVAEIGSDANSPLKDQRVRCIVCSPSDSHFVCSLSPSRSSPRPDSTTSSSKLLLWDLRTQQLERSLPLDSMYVNCCAFNHNGQLLVAGTSDGRIILFDMRTHNSIATWVAHMGELYSLQFSTDETSCFTMGADGKFIQWSVNRTGAKICEVAVHSGAMGPFTTNPGNNHMHHPPGKMFAFDSNGHHILTCGPTGGIVYKMSPGESAVPAVNLGGHRKPVVTVDWSTTLDCGTCLTGSMDGKIQVSTLLAQ